MPVYTQTERTLQVETPLGKDVLLLTGFGGAEEISRLYSFRLEMLSTKEAIDPKEIVGKNISFNILMPDNTRRHFNGFVSRFSNHGQGDRLTMYSAEVVPWLWFLTQTADCRIFQNKTIPDIIEQVFSDLGFSDYKVDLKGTYETLEYVVQYRETDFHFVTRLMEEEGIFYFFKHEQGKHTLMLTDHKGAHPDVAEKIHYGTKLSKKESIDNVTGWERTHEFRTGKVAVTDYNFETPTASLMGQSSTTMPVTTTKKYEVYDYPGTYATSAEGSALAKVRMEEREATHDQVQGASVIATFSAGAKVTVDKHVLDSENGKAYVITSVQHEASIGGSHITGGDVGHSYHNTFTAIPDSTVFRPARTSYKPTVHGVQTAVVVGPSGEEIYTDKYGRIKVQFYWDREGKKDEKSSCWLRVAQPWAGKQWGAIFLPRIGNEVVVQFLEGDVDRPIIVGSVYNADMMPPYALPDNKTQSGLKTDSSKTSDGSNELRFEDKKDAEEIYFHAEKDFNRVVENNDTLKVGFEKKDKGDQSIEIFNNQSLKVGCSEASDGSQTIEVWKDRTETVKTGNEKVTIEKGNRDVIVQTGNDTHKIQQGNRAVTIDMGNDTLTIKMGNQTTKLDLGKSETEAMQSIELKVGQSSIKVDQMGVTIKGMMVKIEGQVQTEVKGLMTKVDGTAMLQAKGGLTMIG